jgi:hypothetical protein
MTTGKEDWNVPKPAEIPRPTYVPAALAFGLTFLFWGFVNGPVILTVGGTVVVFALAGWVREMWNE